MNMMDFAWNVFSKSGSIEAFLLYRQEKDFLEKGNAGVYKYSGCCDKGNQGGGQ